MWQAIYTVLTAYAGVYIFYLIPIVYFITIVVSVISSRRARHKRLAARDGIAAVAMGLIALDFVNYLYLFLTETGELLPSRYLLIKYTIGFFLWLWILWYSYEGHFTPGVAGKYFRTRCIRCLWVCAGSLVLAVVGIIMS